MERVLGLQRLSAFDEAGQLNLENNTTDTIGGSTNSMACSATSMVSCTTDCTNTVVNAGVAW